MTDEKQEKDNIENTKSMLRYIVLMYKILDYFYQVMSGAIKTDNPDIELQEMRKKSYKDRRDYCRFLINSSCAMLEQSGKDINAIAGSIGKDTHAVMETKLGVKVNTIEGYIQSKILKMYVLRKTADSLEQYVDLHNSDWLNENAGVNKKNGKELTNRDFLHDIKDMADFHIGELREDIQIQTGKTPINTINIISAHEEQAEKIVADFLKRQNGDV